MLDLAPSVEGMAPDAAADAGFVFIFDIETTGLSVHKDEITVVCGVVQSIAARETYHELTLNLLATRGDAAAHAEQCRTLCKTLDDARFIAAYNGRRFDLPFVARWAREQRVPADAAAWNAKIIDFYQLILTHVGEHCKMQRVCEENRLPVEKSATGLDAVRWAQSGEWDCLVQYCMQDVHVLRAVLHRSVDEGLHVQVRRSASSAFPSTVYVLRLVNELSEVRVAPLAPAAAPRSSDQGLLDFLAAECSPDPAALRS